MLDLSLLTPLYSGLAVLPIPVPHPDCVVDLGASDAPNPPPRVTLEPEAVVYIAGTDAPNPPPRLTVQPDDVVNITGTEMPNPPPKK